MGHDLKYFNLSLGAKNSIAILDVPFRLQTTSLHNLGHAYISILPNNKLKIAPIDLDDRVGISQCIAILDVMLTLSEEVSLVPPMVSSFSIAGQNFTTLTEGAV